MQEIVKTNVKRQQSSKRHHRRTRYHALYAVLVALLVLGIGVSLSMTVLFNITTIEVHNETKYTQEDIISLSGIAAGDNLVRLDTAVAAEQIRASLPYAESVKVKRVFPSTVEITVTEATAVASVEYSHGYLLISSSNRNLETIAEPIDDLLIIRGFDPANDVPGAYFTSREPGEDDILREISAAALESGVDNIYAIDIAEHFNVMVYYENGNIFEMGSYTDAVYKLKLADAAMKSGELSEERVYRLRMVGDKQISVVSEGAAEVVTTTPAETTVAPTETTTAAE